MTDARYNEILAMTARGFWAAPDRNQFIVRRDSGEITDQHRQMLAASAAATRARELALCYSVA